MIKSAPEWPKKPDAAGRAALAETIVAEFDRFVADNGVSRTGDGPSRTYRGPNGSGHLFWRRTGHPLGAIVRGTTLLTEEPLNDSERRELTTGGVYWLDLAGRTRSRDGSPITEELVTSWLEEGVSKAIARFVLGGVERSQKRFAIMTRTSPPPTAAEIAEMKAENARERAEMDKLLGDAKDTSNLPRATLKR